MAATGAPSHRRLQCPKPVDCCRFANSSACPAHSAAPEALHSAAPEAAHSASPAHSAVPEADPDIVRVSEGLYYNQRFEAHNVWELDVGLDVVEAASSIFDSHLAHHRSEDWHAPIWTPVGGFLSKRVRDMASDIAWISVDDRASLHLMESLFHRTGLADTLASVVPHSSTLRMFSAYFVTRSWCDEHRWHVDFQEPTGTDALTFMTPLRDFKQTQGFGLGYKDTSGQARQYKYRKGKAVVFGSRFWHSTEVGKSVGDQVHTYLCFSFGTDQQDR